MTATDIFDWKELAHRSANGLEVALLWSRAADRVKIAITDDKQDEHFELEVANGDALAAFYHPFAYAPQAGLA